MGTVRVVVRDSPGGNTQVIKGPVHTKPEKFENGGFTLEKHQMFSVHITLEEFENATIIGHFGFVFEENSGRKVTLLS